MPSKKGERNATKRAAKKKTSSSKRIARTPPPRKKACECTPFAPLPLNACRTPQPKQHAELPSRESCLSGRHKGQTGH
eukprot:scaffold195645_cov61-Attheya_sp.AAC.1